jgi:uncharacterized membrane protein YhaH (DUF805 family)
VGHEHDNFKRMDCFNWFFGAVKKYYDFSGRARRKEYWYFVLISTLILTALNLIENRLGTSQIAIASGINIGMASGVFMVLMACPFFAVSTRRLHDANRSAWWLLVNFMPVLGTLVMMVFALEGSYPGENEYGKNPKGRVMFLSY